MNETLNTILGRRSVRKFKTEQISEDELNLILEAGKFAPSAMNQQSWHFTAIQNKKLIDKINEVCKKNTNRAGNKDLSVFHNAPTLIIVSGEEKAIAPECDCSLAMENMFLAAASLNVGSCWIHSPRSLSSSEEGKNLMIELEIPSGYKIIGSGVFGYADCDMPKAAARKENSVNIIK